MTDEQRDVIGSVIALGCPGELPFLMHIDPIELSHVTGMDEAQIRKALSDVRWLGFLAKSREPAHKPEPGVIIDPDSWELTLQWWDKERPRSRDALIAAKSMVDLATETCCGTHARQRIIAGDFSASE